MARSVLLSIVLGLGLFVTNAAARVVTSIEFEITFVDGTKARMTVTDPHFVPLQLPSGNAGVLLTVNPADHNTVGVVFYDVTFTDDADLLQLGPLERKQTRTELGRDTIRVGGIAIQSKTASPFQIRVLRVSHQEQ